MKKILAISLIMVTTACSTVEDSVEAVQNMSTSQIVGTVAGAYVGGTLGAKIGGGIGQLMAISIGVVVGAGSGYTLGTLLDPSDYAFYNDNAQQTLSAKNNGVITQWSNPQTGNGGIFRATRSYTTGDGRYCREFRAAMAVAGTIENRIGSACQQADGTWLSGDDEIG
ncbi:MAG TPA: hypothetical protein ENI69_00220 [Rhodospirillales bacterium]|nr:hypothetical protein [Rhodospirillales bacterium]